MATTTRNGRADQDEYAQTDEGGLLDQVIEKTDTAVLTAITLAELDQKASTARKFHRSMIDFKRRVHEMATMDEETAQTMFYRIPRGGKTIEGPSIRMAEVVACAFGNMDNSARVIAIEEEFIVAQGHAHDLETNNSARYEVRRRIVDKYGKRFNVDMIQVTGNAAAAIAFREAIFKVVPRSLFKKEYELAKLCAIGKAVSMNEKRRSWIEWYKKAGASEAAVLAFLGRKGIDDMTVEDLLDLTGISTAIKDGEITIEDALAIEGEAPKGSRVKKAEAGQKIATSSKPAPTKSEPLDGSTQTTSQPVNVPADIASKVPSEADEQHAKEHSGELPFSSEDQSTPPSKAEMFAGDNPVPSFPVNDVKLSECNSMLAAQPDVEAIDSMFNGFVAEKFKAMKEPARKIANELHHYYRARIKALTAAQ